MVKKYNPFKTQWDWSFIFKLLAIKFYLMERYFRYHTVIVPEEAELNVRTLRIARRLCKRLTDGKTHYKIIHKFQAREYFEAEHRVRRRDLQRLFKIMDKYLWAWWD